MTTRILAVMTIALAALTAAGCGNAKLNANDIVLVCGEHVTQAQFTSLLDQQKARAGAQLPKVGTSEYEQLKRQIVEVLAQQAAYRHKADQFGIEISDKQVEDKINELVVTTYGGKRSAFLADIKRAGLTEEGAKDIIRFGLMQEELKAKIVAGIDVSDKDARAYYDKNKVQYLTATTRQVAHILVKTKAKADDLVAQLAAGGDFAELAKKHSIDKRSAVAGGELTAEKGKLVPEFEKVAFGLDTGEVSAPVKSEFGYHIIKAIGPTKLARQQTFVQVKPLVVQTIRQTKEQAAVTEWVNDVNKECVEKADYATGYKPASSPQSNPAPVNTRTS